jgi:serine/threonine-protein kinase
MAPEQINGMPVTGQTDVFALGTILYFAFTNSYPFTGKNPMMIMHSINKCEYELARNKRPNLDKEISNIIEHCLKHDPAKRYKTVVALRKDLEKVQARLQRAGAGILGALGQNAANFLKREV